MAVDLSIVFVIAVRCAEHGGTDGAGEMINMILVVKRCNIGSSKRSTTLMTQQVQPAKVVGLAKGVLGARIFFVIVDGKEFGGYDCPTILHDFMSV